MRVLVDGQALQTGAAADAAGSLLHTLGRNRPGWEWALVEAGHLPPVAAQPPANVRRFTFQPPRPVTPFDRRDGRINERYYGDWLSAQHLNALVVLNYFDPEAVVPRFTEPRALVIGVVQDLSALGRMEASWQDAQARQWYCARLRLLLEADTLIVPSPVVERELRELLPELPACIIVSDNLAEAVCEAAAITLPAVPRAAKRIAWVSPLPPTPSGIADYSADLLPSLAKQYDIDLVIDPNQQTVAPDLAARHWTLTAAEAVQRHAVRPYDLFVYQLGNSGYHAYMLDLMRRFRGLVGLHDYFMGGLVASCRSRGLWPTTAGEELEYEGETQFADWQRQGFVNDFVVRQLTAQNRRLLSLADAVVVHSAWSWQRVRRLVDVPVARVPMPMPLPKESDSQETLRRRLGLPIQAFVIASLGHNGHVKRLPSLLRGVADLPVAMRAACQVVLVGPMDANDRTELARFAGDLGLSGQVRATGWVSADDFTAYIRAADVCVQLRYPTFGETSASVLRALAAGTPCIASDQGPMAELPDRVVPKVRSPHDEVADLTALLETLFAHPDRRAALAHGALRYIAEQHAPALATAAYAAAMEQMIARRRERDANWHEATADALLDGILEAGPERERLSMEWAELRDRALQPGECRAGTFVRKAG